MIDKTSMHFRFRSDDPLFGYVWEDIRDASKVLPLYEGNVFAKILRIGGNSDEKRKIILKRKNFDQSGPVFQNLQSQSNPPRSASVPRPNEETSSSPPPPKPVKPLAKPAATATSAPPPTAPAAAPSVKSPPINEPNFFDTESDSKAAGAYSPPPDILNFDESPFTPASSSAKLKPSTTSSRSPMATSASAMDIDDDSGNTSRSATGGELNRAELAARKEEAIEDKVRSALEFKKEVDQKKEREQAEFDSAKAKHEQALNVISMVLNLSKEFLHYLSLLSLSVFIVDVGNEQQGEKKCAHSAVDHACKLVATT